MSDTAWTAGATVALALATLVVALVTLYTARQTKDLANHTKNLAVHAEQQVRLMETARQLEASPYLTFERGNVTRGPVTHYSATVVNIGKGPGINCLLARYEISNVWYLSGNFEVGAGQATTDSIVAMAQSDPIPSFLSQMGSGRIVIFCLDQFGSLHMFDPSRRSHVWPAEGAEPEWAKWYQSRLDTR